MKEEILELERRENILVSELADIDARRRIIQDNCPHPSWVQDREGEYPNDGYTCSTCMAWNWYEPTKQEDGTWNL